MWCEGVMRVAHIDMRITSVNCPTPLTQYELDLGERECVGHLTLYIQNVTL